MKKSENEQIIAQEWVIYFDGRIKQTKKFIDIPIKSKSEKQT